MTATENPLVIAHTAISMARAMRNLGRPARAVAKYDEAIAALPEFIEALDECLAVLESSGDWQGIADRCATWVAKFPDHATHADADRIHARRIDALCAIGGIDLAFDAYAMEPIARTDITVGSDEILAVIGLRDELDRLPHVLDHHRRLGVNRFLVIDNGSTDGSLEELVDQPDTVVWRTEGSYRAANCGAAWWDLLLRRYARGNWCLIIDADEYFIFPGWETRGLHDLCGNLDARGATCFPAVFLDMYGPGRLSDSPIRPDQDLLETFPYFDRNWYRMRRGLAGPRFNLLNHWGGVRARIFGDRAMDSYLLDKVPLFRHQAEDVLLSGNHWINRPSDQISDGRGVLLHFKYDAGFAMLITREAERGEHAGGARAYKRIADGLEVEADPQFFDPTYSVRYENSEQLLRYGILRTETADAHAPDMHEQVAIPEIPEVSGIISETDPEHAFWSVVMLATGADFSRRLDATLRSLDGEPPSEVVLVITADASDLLPTLPDSGEHLIRLETTHLHLTELEALNHGIAGSRGRWVKVAGDDSDTHRSALRNARAIIEDENADFDAVIIDDPSTALLELPLDPPLDLPLDLPVSSVLIRRDCLPRVGGFATTIEAATGWEFAQRVVGGDGRRIAVIPGAPAVDAVPPRLPSTPPASMEFGVDIAHRLDAITLVSARLGLEPDAVQRLLDRCATDASNRIVQDIERGSIGSALSVLTEILRAEISDDSRHALVNRFSRRLR